LDTNQNYNMRSVLLVDDDDVCNFIMSRALRNIDSDVEILTAMNGKQAIELLNKLLVSNVKAPSIIFLDINMPVMDGFAFLKAYKNIGYPQDAIKIVIVTSSNHAGDIKKAQAEGVSDFIIKPVDEKMLAKFLIP
jgi:CheY-like chemotaxis protein